MVSSIGTLIFRSTTVAESVRTYGESKINQLLDEV